MTTTKQDMSKDTARDAFEALYSQSGIDHLIWDAEVNTYKGIAAELWKFYQAATLAAPQWLPIETAPRDGTHVLIHGQFEGYGENRLAVGMWDGEMWSGARPDGVVILDPDKWLPLPLTATPQGNL